MATAKKKKKVTKKPSVKKAKSSSSSAKAESTPKAKAKPKKAKEKEPELSAAELTEALVSKMNSSPTYRGKVTVKSARDYQTPYNLRRPTGVMGVDWALRGGFPAGGASQIYGPKGTGKTHLAFRVAGEVQKNYGSEAVVALGVSEGRADVGFARSAGFCMAYSKAKIDELDEIRASNGVPRFTKEERQDLMMQIGEVIFLHGTTGGDMLQSTIEVVDHYGSRCQLMIIDSLGSLLTPDQDKGKVSDRQYGGSSGIITTWQTKIQPKFLQDQPDGSCLETTIIGINQVRAMIGGPTPNMVRPAAGAKSWEHAQLNSLELKRGEPLWADTKHTRQAGHVVKWNLKKGKAGTHDGLKGEYDWRHILDTEPIFWKDVVECGKSYAIDVVSDLVETARKIGVVEVRGKWNYYRDENGDILIKGDGVDAFSNEVENNPELEERMRQDCLDASNLTVRYT